MIDIQNKIILLDLNYTLASYIKMDKNFCYDVSKDIYRQDLYKAICNNKVFLVTARTDNYKQETINKIIHTFGSGFDRYYFKPIQQKYVKAHEFKASVIAELCNEGFMCNDFFGIESNINTRKKYKELGIVSMPYKDFMESLNVI